MGGQEPLGLYPLKTTTFWVLALGWGLAALHSQADSVPISQFALLADNGENATTNALATIGQPAPLTVTVTGAYAGFFSNSLASTEGHPMLGLDGYHQPGAIDTIKGVPQTGSVAMDRDSASNSDVGASFILIALGGGLLGCLRWKMSHSPPSDEINAR
jgi:hypothetical protein